MVILHIFLMCFFYANLPLELRDYAFFGVHFPTNEKPTIEWTTTADDLVEMRTEEDTMLGPIHLEDAVVVTDPSLGGE